MAATVTSSGELTFMSFAIEKTEKTPDGDLIVYGKATDGSVDSDEQIVDPEFSSKAIADWLASGANVRVQHNSQRDPAGVGIEVNTGADGETWVKSLVVEPVAKRLVEKGALRAYSVGIARPKIVRDSVARGGRIVGGEIVEISLVDRPANKNCGIQLVKSDGAGKAEWVGKVFGNEEVVNKTATVEETITLPTSATFSPADLAKLLEHRQLAEKRQMDPNVGGGVDRDKIPAADFAGRDRSFPIVTPGDVSDAASSIGRAGASNYGSDQLKANIIRIARRKGDAFVAALPESWKKELAGASKSVDDLEVTKSDDGVDPDDEDEDEMADETTKGLKDCPSCGKGYDGDAKTRRCEGCGKKLPKATSMKGDKPVDEDEVVKPDATKGDDSVGDDDHDDDCTCTKCNMPMGKSAKFCSECGTPAVAKSGGSTPADGVVGVEAEPAPAHREPDGADVEALEADAGMSTTPDSSVKSVESPESAALMRLKSTGAPTDLGVLHDLTCPGFHPADVSKCYPSQSWGTIDVSSWQAKALNAAVSAPLNEATRATELWQHAVTLKGIDSEVMDEVRLEAHKSFADANPGPGSFPVPTKINPASFRRPVIITGQSKPGTDYDGPNTHSVPSGVLSASDFTRGYLDAGRASNSPSNKNVGITPPPAGTLQRTYYRNTQRESAREAMSAMHDHIAQTFPDLCPMAGPGRGGQAPAGARPVPVPVGATKGESGDKAKAKVKVKKNKGAVLNKSVDTDLMDLLTSMQQQLDLVTKALDEQRNVTATLQKSVDALGDLPDPTTAPFRGVAQPVTVAKSSGMPASAQTVAETAERTQLMMMRELEAQFRTSPDPAQREAAWNALVKMRGLPS